MKMPIALLGALSQKEQTLITTATYKAWRLSSASTTILENYLTMKLPINATGTWHKKFLFMGQYLLQFIAFLTGYSVTAFLIYVQG